MCECRLSWIFELRNRTKNNDLRRTLERTLCSMETSNANALTVDNNNNHYNNYKTAQRTYSHGNEYDLDDPFRRSNDLGNQLGGLEPKPNRVSHETVELLRMDVNHLPCELLTEPTELPLSRESVGMDISRVFQFSASPAAIQGNIIAICTLCLIALLTVS